MPAAPANSGTTAGCTGKLWKQVQDRRVRITCAYISWLFVFQALHMVSACSLSGTDKSRRIKVVLFSRTSQWTYVLSEEVQGFLAFFGDIVAGTVMAGLLVDQTGVFQFI